MKNLLACAIVLLLAATASAQCAGGRCVSRTVTRSWYTAPPIVQYSAPVVQYSLPATTQTVVTAPAIVTSTPIAVVQGVAPVVYYRRPLLGWRYNFSLVAPVVVQGPVLQWSLVQ